MSQWHQLHHHFYVQVMEMTDLSALVGKKKKRAEQHNDNLINRGKDVNEPVSP